MKKILILHRSDLYNLTSDLAMQDIEAEHFKIQIKDFNSASFIAFEENGLLKILKNDRGACVTIPYASLLMAIEMVTKQEAIRAQLPKDAQEEYFRPDNDTIQLPPDYADFSKLKGYIQPDGKIHRILNRIPNDPYFNMFNIGYDPTAKNQLGPVAVVYDPHQPNNTKAAVAIFKGRDDEPEKFHKEVIKTAEYYGHQLLEDYNDEINSSVATAFEQKDFFWHNRDVFPETLWEAILFFIIYFSDVPNLVFQHTEIHFTSTLRISHPEIYAKIKKECGFWCQDTQLYKNLSTIYKCDHEECLINTILKGIYRYRNLGRDRSDHFKDVFNSYKPQ
jgi:hypothetical protein